MEVQLIDGTYELFRHFYALQSAKDSEGREVAAVRGVLGSLLGMMRAGTTYIGVATDHMIESFRNGMWPGYKTGQGVDPELLAQFPLLEETLNALGVVVWAMEEYEADDGSFRRTRRQSHKKTLELSASSSVLRIKILLNAFRERE
jgi:5'-3' exonuclease